MSGRGEPSVSTAWRKQDRSPNVRRRAGGPRELEAAEQEKDVTSGIVLCLTFNPLRPSGVNYPNPVYVDSVVSKRSVSSASCVSKAALLQGRRPVSCVRHLCSLQLSWLLKSTFCHLPSSLVSWEALSSVSAWLLMHL